MTTDKDKAWDILSEAIDSLPLLSNEELSELTDDTTKKLQELEERWNLETCAICGGKYPKGNIKGHEECYKNK